MARRGCRRPEEDTRSNTEKKKYLTSDTSLLLPPAPPPPRIRLILRLSLVANNVCQWYFPCKGITRGCLRQCNQTIKHRAASFAEWFPSNRKGLDMSYSSFLSSIKEISSSEGKCTTRSLQICKLAICYFISNITPLNFPANFTLLVLFETNDFLLPLWSQFKINLLITQEKLEIPNNAF